MAVLMSTNDEKPVISFVIPTFNEAANIDALYAELLSVMANLQTRYDFEVIITDNDSTDQTVAKVKEIVARDPRFKLFCLAKNYGYQKSILTAYLNTTGDAVIQLDADLQDPPQFAERFLEYWERGYKVVYGIRRSRDEAVSVSLFRKVFYRLINAISKDNLPVDAGDFRLIDRAIVDDLRKIDDQYPYLRGSISQLGYNQIGLEYDRRRRKSGESKFGLWELCKFAVNGIMHHSSLPLRFAAIFGAMLSVITLAVAMVYFILRLAVGQNWPSGFASLLIVDLFALGINALFLGIIGEYVGRIYKQQKHMPLTIIREVVENDRAQLESTTVKTTDSGVPTG